MLEGRLGNVIHPTSIIYLLNRSLAAVMTRRLLTYLAILTDVLLLGNFFIVLTKILQYLYSRYFPGLLPYPTTLRPHAGKYHLTCLSHTPPAHRRAWSPGPPTSSSCPPSSYAAAFSPSSFSACPTWTPGWRPSWRRLALQDFAFTHNWRPDTYSPLPSSFSS